MVHSGIEFTVHSGSETDNSQCLGVHFIEQIVCTSNVAVAVDLDHLEVDCCVMLP